MQEQAGYEIGREAHVRPVAGTSEIESPAAAARRGFSIARREGPWRDALLRRMLALADLLAGITATVSLVTVGSARLGTIVWLALFAPVWILVAKVLGLYDRDQRSLRHLTVDELPSIFMWSLTSTATVALLLALTPSGWLKAGEVIRLGIVSAVTALVLRVLARNAWRRATPSERAVIIGDATAARGIRRKLELFPDIHVSVTSELRDLNADELAPPPPALARADRIVLVSPPLDEQLISRLVAFCRLHQIKLSVVPGVRGFFGTGVELKHVADLPLLEFNTWDVSRSTQLLKRVLDILVSLTALVVLAPLLALVALLVLIDSGRPVLFTHVRSGQNARPFTMLKFRTMVPDAEEMLDQLLPLVSPDEPVFKLREDPRVTWFGRFLRRTSLDELPQFVNVLLGTMSLVGPRPEQVHLVERYAPDHLFRLTVKPGMTGPMQVYGRGELSFAERLAVEREYVENLSVARDLHILALTIASLFHGRGAF